jgi:propanol-preferring alcohol dehydrogenase
MVGAGGHEAAGIVWKTDGARYVKPGDRVSIYPTAFENCCRCPACLAGEWMLCSSPKTKRSLMGTHTQYMLVPEYVCLPIPDEMPFVIGAMLDDCIGTPYRGIRRTGVRAGDTVLVTGVGPIGAAAVVIAKFLNAVVIAVETNGYRLNHASLLGADYTLNPTKDDVLARVRGITANRGADVAIDCSGVDVAQVQCLDAVRQGGKVAFIGIKSETTSINILRQFILKELTAIGSWASTPQEHFEIIRLIQRGMPVDRLITHQYGIDDAPTAFRKFFNGEAVKVSIDPWKAGSDQ